MSFTINIPTHNGSEKIVIEAGSSIIFVGANGSGKTRLSIIIENDLELKAHRISAHRALSLNPGVKKISESSALAGLRIGYEEYDGMPQYRSSRRWNNNEAVALLNDFDYLIQALFAEQANIALSTHNKNRNQDYSPAEPTKFEILVKTWEHLLPHRNLYVSGDDIMVSKTGCNNKYSARDMSDGERAIFYMIGQTLMAANDSLIIFDEPELHVHPSIMSKLWDEIEALRPDCAFVFITHDLQFASSRVSDKYVLKSYDPTPFWEIEKVPQDSGFSEEITTLILGSRKPILFVEGSSSSLDIAIYRSCFTDWTIIPKGSCQDVIHSVVTMRNNKSLTRITCSGVVDADDYSEGDKQYLAELGIAVLPVSEIENLILMPEVSAVIARYEGYSNKALDEKLTSLSEKIFSQLNSTVAIENVIIRYCKRRIDRALKKIDLSGAETISALKDKYNEEISSLDIDNIGREIKGRIEEAIQNKDLPLLLKNYDNKGMIALAATNLKSCRLQDFESWLVRVLNNGSIPDLTSTIKSLLPEIQAQ
ncbi:MULTISPECIES: AAA family ATPase [unclassified Providencia]|uniref:AAA family ATPase n=1 Tax=unclassified Providencia TaxID=2633465 RepID=UPI00234BE4B2|nr:MULTISPECIES: AAA family ATPase [unclassified Providencia]